MRGENFTISKGELIVSKFKFWDFDKRIHYYSDSLEQISATDLQKCKNCEWYLYYKLTQPKITIKSPYLCIGSVFHSVVENDLRFFVKRGVHYKWFDIEIYFNAIWEKEKQNCDFTRLSEDKTKVKAKNYVQIYYQKAIQLLYPLNQESIEKFFCIPISYHERKLKISGKIDLIDKSMFIVDHKTSSSQWTQDDAEQEAQAIIYPYCFKMQGYDIQGFKFNVVSGVNVVPFPILYNQTKVKEWLIFAFDVKERLETGNQLKSKLEKTCRWCDWFLNGICKESLIKNEIK